MKRLAPTWIEIDLAALRSNFAALKAKLPADCKTLGIVKSNAYGHGALEVARALREADGFGVGTIDEGIELREGGIEQTILVLLGLISSHEEELLQYRLTPVLYDPENARQLNSFLQKKNQTLEIHLKVDTGMTRLGMLASEARSFFEEVAKLSHLKPVGLLSHLADADEEEMTGKQVQKMRAAWQEFVRVFPAAKFYHLANSLATIDGKIFSPKEGREVMARLGIALYGAYPLPRQEKKIKLQPVMSWKSRLIAIKKVPKGTPVSYGMTFRTRRESRIGVIPVGYADGYFRSLSNEAHVLVGGRRVPIVGRVCMDLMMVDLTSLPQVKVGDEVVLLGREGKEEISASELAKMAGTISYEIFCRVSTRLERRYL